MFDFLKKKIQTWIKPKEEVKKKLKKESKSTKKSTKKEKKVKKEPKIKTIKEKIQEKEVEEIIEQAESSPVEQSEEKNEQAEESKGNFFTRLIKKISSHKISQQEFDEIFQEFEITLLENNVALEAVDKIRVKLSEQLVGQEIKAQEVESRVLLALKESILSVVHEPPSLIEKINSKEGPFVIVFFGINGTGKTTSIAKLSHFLTKNKISNLLAAGDTFRAASIEQLKTHADKLKVPIISHNYNSDPAAVAFDAIQYAKKHDIKVILIDTAGRMYTKANLMKEMEKIIRISKPDLKIFVGESITGNDVIDQVKTFNEAIGIDGIILSKADIDEKAGTILSVSEATNKPIYFLGTGQKYEDLLPFTKKAVLRNLGLE